MRCGVKEILLTSACPVHRWTSGQRVEAGLHSRQKPLRHIFHTAYDRIYNVNRGCCAAMCKRFPYWCCAGSLLFSIVAFVRSVSSCRHVTNVLWPLAARSHLHSAWGTVSELFDPGRVAWTVLVRIRASA